MTRGAAVGPLLSFELPGSVQQAQPERTRVAVTLPGFFLFGSCRRKYPAGNEKRRAQHIAAVIGFLHSRRP